MIRKSGTQAVLASALRGHKCAVALYARRTEERTAYTSNCYIVRQSRVKRKQERSARKFVHPFRVMMYPYLAVLHRSRLQTSEFQSDHRASIKPTTRLLPAPALFSHLSQRERAIKCSSPSHSFFTLFSRVSPLQFSLVTIDLSYKSDIQETLFPEGNFTTHEHCSIYACTWT